MLKVIEAEYLGKPTFLIGDEINGKIVRAVKWIDPTDGGNVVFVSRIEWAWHSPIREEAVAGLEYLKRGAQK